MSGPKNFVARVKKELQNYDLAPYEIINPSPNDTFLLDRYDILKVGRLDGAIYYKATSENLYNLIRQRRENISKFFNFLKYLPNSSTMFLNHSLNNKLNRFSRNVQKKSDVVIFQSEFSKKMQDIFVGAEYKNKPYITILNGVPIEIFNPYVEKIELEGSIKLVITASFRLHKRLQDAINLTNYLKKKYLGIKLHIIGDMDNLTKEMVTKLDTSSCVFHNRIKSELLPKFYNSCDIGLSPSMFDPCPNSVVEMMGCGLPVITTKESGASELIGIEELFIKENLPMKYYELQTAYTIPNIDINLWAKKVEEILDNKIKYKTLVLDRINKELDIKLVAKKYAQFIGENSVK